MHEQTYAEALAERARKAASPEQHPSQVFSIRATEPLGQSTGATYTHTVMLNDEVVLLGIMQDCSHLLTMVDECFSEDQ